MNIKLGFLKREKIDKSLHRSIKGKKREDSITKTRKRQRHYQPFRNKKDYKGIL